MSLLIGQYVVCAYTTEKKGFRKRVQWGNQNPTSLSATNSQVSIRGSVSFHAVLADNSSHSCTDAGS